MGRWSYFLAWIAKTFPAPWGLSQALYNVLQLILALATPVLGIAIPDPLAKAASAVVGFLFLTLLVVAFVKGSKQMRDDAVASTQATLNEASLALIERDREVRRLTGIVENRKTEKEVRKDEIRRQLVTLKEGGKLAQVQGRMIKSSEPGLKWITLTQVKLEKILNKEFALRLDDPPVGMIDTDDFDVPITVALQNLTKIMEKPDEWPV